MATIPQPDVFEQAHIDARQAVATFLPSLTAKPPVPPPQPPPQVSPKVREGMRAMSTIRNAEQSARRVARGLPPQPPPPPSPQETFPPAIDQVHIRALAAAIAAHPETQRPALLHEAHANITKWIAAHNGQIVHDGHVEIAGGPESAEKLAAKIVNGAVDEHDQREASKRDQAQGKGPSVQPPSSSEARNVDGTGGNETQPEGGSGGQGNISSQGRPVPAARQPSAGVAILPDNGGGRGQVQPNVGGVDSGSGRVVTQSSQDLDTAQDNATAAAPELKDTLGQVEDSVPGAEVDGVREEKDPDRAQQKIEADGKPAHTLTDLLAGRVAVDSPEAKDAAVEQIKDSAPVIDEEDNFKDGDPDYGFRSHTLQVGLDGGNTSAEVQVVPKEIAEADKDTHDTYEKGREAEASGDDKTAQAAMSDNKEFHDKAMDKFEERNSDRPGRIVKSLTDSGFKVRGKPVKIGGHLFVPVVDDDA